jgi:hypothetical protein
MNIEQVVYGTKDNETYLTIVLKTVKTEDYIILENRPAVYKLFDKAGELMYIGETKSLKTRIRNHLSPKTAGHDEIHRGTIGYIEYVYLNIDRYERAIVEGILVNRHNPKYNCNDEEKANSIRKVPLEVLKDIQFYLRNTDLPARIIGEGLGQPRALIQSVKHSGTGNDIELPKDFTPSIIITDEFVKNFKAPRKRITKEVFMNVRNLLDSGIKGVEVSKLTGVEQAMVSEIKLLKAKKYQKWEQERIKEVA